MAVANCLYGRQVDAARLRDLACLGCQPLLVNGVRHTSKDCDRQNHQSELEAELEEGVIDKNCSGDRDNICHSRIKKTLTQKLAGIILTRYVSAEITKCGVYGKMARGHQYRGRDHRPRLFGQVLYQAAR